MGICTVIYAEVYDVDKSKWITFDLNNICVPQLKNFEKTIEKANTKYKIGEITSDKLDDICESLIDQYSGICLGTNAYWFNNPFIEYGEIKSSSCEYLRSYLDEKVFYVSIDKMHNIKNYWKHYDKNIYEKLGEIKQFMIENKIYSDMRFLIHLA